MELVDLPRERALLDVMARLLDERPLGEREQLARLLERKRILVLLARRDESARFDVEPRFLAGNANTHRHVAAAREIALAHLSAGKHLRSPGSAFQQKFTLDLSRHVAMIAAIQTLVAREQRERLDVV